MDVHVSETYKWAEAFTDLQFIVNAEIRNASLNGKVVVKELQDVDATVKKLSRYIEDGAGPTEDLVFQTSKEDFEKSIGNFSDELYLLGKEVDRLFKILIKGRSALMSNLIDGKCDLVSEAI